MTQTMYFAVMTRDNPDAGDKRQKHYPEHRAHLDAQPDGLAIRISGPLLGENGKPVGSLLIIEAETIGQVRKYINSDPYIDAGVWSGFSVNAYDWRRGRPED
ncbi:MAG: hypothetical protein JKX93_13325 [Rhizobiaceae bacterium]|nr:hypothetical protein [Rhizobiaceae bacterium]MBL4696860.1 hypothetical protein [Rhizobiaceae bacterium]